MLKNYFKIALRNLRKHKGYAAISIFSLALGLAACLLIVGYVQDELQYDRYHQNADQIARLVRESSGLSAAPMGPAMANDLPGVAYAVRITGEDKIGVEAANNEVAYEAIYLADSTIFDIFTLPFIAGNPATALRRPDGLVISSAVAQRYFPDTDPLGQTLTIHFEEPATFTVTGVMKDMPAASHVRFDLLASFEVVAQQSGRMENWSTNWLFTYLLLNEGTTPAQLEQQLPTFFEQKTGEAWDHFRIQPLLDIHLRSAHLEYDIAPQGNITYVLLFSAVAVLILLIACINFMNLATARSAKRAREVGMRKVLGANRRQLILQFLGETFLLTVLALVLAAGLVSMLLPAFHALTGKDLTLMLADGGIVLLVIIALTLLTAFLAGSYPALFLSAVRPARILQSTGRQPGSGGVFRKALVVVQFALSIFLIAAALVVQQQLKYVQHARLGFDKEQILVMDFGEALSERYEIVKQELLRHPNVLAATASDNVPGGGTSDFYYRPEGWPEDDLPGWDTYFVDADYLGTLAMEMARGHAFRPDIAADTGGFLINETAHQALVDRLGDAWANPLGKKMDFYLPGEEGWEVFRSGPVLGVVKDFHYRSLHAEISPLVMQVLPFAFDYLLVKVSTDELPGTLAFLETQWSDFGPDRPFEYTFLDERFGQLYRGEERAGMLLGAFSLLAILIACMGLFGLAAFTAEQRTKEIGVRKVLGASVSHVALLLSSDFARLVVISFFIGAPLAYLAAQRWLNGFAYRVELSAGLFLLVGLLALAIALITVSYHAVRAALADPVQSLRYE